MAKLRQSLLFLLLVLSFFFLQQTSSDATCYSAYECSGEYLSLSGGQLDCYGTSSCANSTLVLGSSSSKIMHCYGAFSCIHSVMLVSKNSFILEVYGWLGLAFATMNSTSASLYISVEAHAEGSLYKANVWMPSGKIECYGFRSCDSLQVHTSGTVLGRASLSLVNSVIWSTSTGSGNLKVSLTGLYAGYNATIYCQSGDSCELNCYGNGCKNTYFICADDAQECLINADNNSSAISPLSSRNETIAPISEISLELDKDRNLVMFLEDYDNVDWMGGWVNQTCGNDVMCLDDSECASTYMNLDETVCCMGRYGCSESLILLNQQADLYTSGQVALKAGTAISVDNIYVSARAGIGSADEARVWSFGTMMARAHYAAWNAAIQYGEYMTCDGHYSCWNASITSVSSIYASGYQSLLGSEIVTKGVDVEIFLLTYDAAPSMSVTCSSSTSKASGYDKCTIYCTNGACANLDLSNSTCCDVINSDTMSPTPRPTLVPTILTNEPSDSPTNVPTNVPTNANISDDASGPDSSETSSSNGYDAFLRDIKKNMAIIVGVAMLLISCVLVFLSVRLHRKWHDTTVVKYATHYDNLMASFDDDDDSSGYKLMKSKPRPKESIGSVLDFESGVAASASHGTIFVVALTIFDVYTDINYVVNLISCNVNLAYPIFFALSIVSEMLYNVYCLRRIYFIEGARPQVAQYVKRYAVCVVFATLMSLFDIKLLVSILTSQMFGNIQFYAPLKRSTVSELNARSAFAVPCHLVQFTVLIVLFVSEPSCEADFGVAAMVATLFDLILALITFVTWKYVHKVHRSESIALSSKHTYSNQQRDLTEKF